MPPNLHPAVSGSLSIHAAITHYFYRLVALTSIMGGCLVWAWPSLTPAPLDVGMLWVGFGVVAWACSRSERATQPLAVMALCTAMSAAVMLASHLEGWDIDGAGLPFLLLPLFSAAVLCRPGDALALLGLNLVALLALMAFGHTAVHPPDALHPPQETRLVGLVAGMSMAVALGLALGQALRRVLQERENLFLRYRSLFNQVPVAVLLHRHDRILDANDEAVRLFGFEGRRSLMNSRVSERLEPTFVPVMRERVARLAASRPGTQLPAVDCVAVGTKGAPIPVRVVCVRWTDEPDTTVLSILSDIREQTALADELRRARDAAEAANRAKDRFLATTSHEIRTPLNGIIGLLGMVRDPATDEATRQRYLALMADGAESLKGLLSDVLDLAKVDAGKFEIRAEPLHLHALLQAVAESHRVLAEAKGLGFALHADVAPGLQVQGDAQRLRQVLVNLLSNALKFTARGHVRLAVSRQADGRTLFEVEDTGAGIDPSDQARLFEPFTQAEDSRSRSYGGTGLGLSICRRIVELMGGRIGVHSLVGRGSRFWFDLPLPEAPVPALATPGDADWAEAVDGPIEAARWATTSAHASPKRAHPFSTLKPGADATPWVSHRLVGRRILVVDDNQVNLLITGYLLERHGAHVVTATSGERALVAARQALVGGQPFDLVFMDIQMPGLDGCDTTRMLRTMSPPHLGPVLALTAGTDTAEAEAAHAAGMLAVLSKPLDEPQLLAAVAEHLANRSP